MHGSSWVGLGSISGSGLKFGNSPFGWPQNHEMPLEIRMRSFLMNKNLSLYYWLKKRIGRRMAFLISNTIEKGILVFGREQVENGPW